MTTSVILLAGGTGARMNAAVPKQYLTLKQQPIVNYSLDVFLSIPEISEIIVVCDPAYRHYFDRCPVKFALPGARRQDSVYNGFQAASRMSRYICVHDSARPFIDSAMVYRVLAAAEEHGAATVGMPVKFTVKETHRENFVKSTPDRSKMWEIQTPQVIRADLLSKGFEIAIQNGLTVTDDVSLAELISHPVKLVEGSYANLKITTPEDMLLAETLT